MPKNDVGMNLVSWDRLLATRESFGAVIGGETGETRETAARGGDPW